MRIRFFWEGLTNGIFNVKGCYICLWMRWTSQHKTPGSRSGILKLLLKLCALYGWLPRRLVWLRKIYKREAYNLLTDGISVGIVLKASITFLYIAILLHKYAKINSRIPSLLEKQRAAKTFEEDLEHHTSGYLVVYMEGKEQKTPWGPEKLNLDDHIWLRSSYDFFLV